MTDTEPLAARARNKGEIAQYYGVSNKVVNRWLRQNGLEHLVKHRGTHYYTVFELQQIAAVLGDRTQQFGLFG